MLWTGIIGYASAQELRRPTEEIDIVIKSTYPVRINAVIASDDKLYVWVDYRNIWRTDPEKGYDRYGFTAKKLLIYEGKKLVREILGLKDMPDPHSIGYDSILHGVEVSPISTGQPDNKFTVFATTENALAKLGFANNKFVLGPFNYQINGIKPLLKDYKGFIYIMAQCSNNEEQKNVRGGWEPFQVLYRVNTDGLLVDSFIFNIPEMDETKIAPSYETSFLSNGGNFYQVLWPTAPSKRVKITVQRWAPKGN